FMVARVDASEQPVTIVATGPLTNVARFLSVHRGEGLARIVVMGGSIGEGNMTPAAEFNIWADPEAAQRVFSSGLDVTMIGLESSASEGSARVARMSLAELQTSVLEDPSLGSEGQRVLAWTRANMTRRGRWLARLRGRPTRSRTTKGTCSGCSSRTRISCSTTAPI
ncbi:MAG: nucleoside hydrolase, partial [Actinobacteria bacterium]|nr:nucleoside hydrolase [Actinomycetota bacterium]